MIYWRLQHNRRKKRILSSLGRSVDQTNEPTNSARGGYALEESDMKASQLGSRQRQSIATASCTTATTITTTTTTTIEEQHPPLWGGKVLGDIYEFIQLVNLKLPSLAHVDELWNQAIHMFTYGSIIGAKEKVLYQLICKSISRVQCPALRWSIYIIPSLKWSILSVTTFQLDQTFCEVLPWG